MINSKNLATAQKKTDTKQMKKKKNPGDQKGINTLVPRSGRIICKYDYHDTFVSPHDFKSPAKISVTQNTFL